MTQTTLEATLADIAQALLDLDRPFALVGGIAVSLRAEVRFTRDVDVAVSVKDDADFEELLFALRASGYFPVATVEHAQQKRLSTARLQSPQLFVVDLIAASCGIEQEVVERATLVDLPGVRHLLVARPEELLAMKVLSMSDRRLQDQLDAINLVNCSKDLNLQAVRDNLDRITLRGFHRQQDLHAKLSRILKLAKLDE